MLKAYFNKNQFSKNFNKYGNKILYKFPIYNLLTIRTRRDRSNQGLANPNILVDDVTYYKQMKEFIKETQGVPRNSVKWNQLRNKHYGILREIWEKSQSQDFKETSEISFIRFYLIVLAEDTDSYELVSILNFYNIKYKALEDTPTSKIILKQMLGLFNKENYKNYKFPFLQFESSEEPTQNIDGIDNILSFMIENNFIHDFRTHSAYEKGGKEFLKKFEEWFEFEFKRPLSKFYFYWRFTNFKEAKYWYHPFKDGYVYRNRMISRLYRMTKSILTDFFSYKKIKKNELKNSEKNLKELIDNWVNRLNNKPFHGGESPDSADFRDWEARMALLTLRTPYYNLRENFYMLNEYHSDKVLEQTRINKTMKEKEDEKIIEKENKNSGETLLKPKINVKNIFANRKTKINTNI